MASHSEAGELRLGIKWISSRFIVEINRNKMNYVSCEFTWFKPIRKMAAPHTIAIMAFVLTCVVLIKNYIVLALRCNYDHNGTILNGIISYQVTYWYCCKFRMFSYHAELSFLLLSHLTIVLQQVIFNDLIHFCGWKCYFIFCRTCTHTRTHRSPLPIFLGKCTLITLHSVNRNKIFSYHKRFRS